MARDFQQTHENILSSGKKLFLKKSYERTNLREICKDANVTTGAFYRHFSDKESLFGELVSTAVSGINERYADSVEECFNYIAAGELVKVWQVSYETIAGFIEYIYDHFDSFKLLLTCSDGTKYSMFVDDLVTLEVANAIKFLNILKERHVTVNVLSENELHMLTHSYFSSVFETVMHDFSKEEALNYAHTLVGFYNAGWRFVLGI